MIITCVAMQLKIIFVLFVLALIGADGFKILCNLKRARNYKMDILVAAREDQSYESICRSVSNFLREVRCREIKRHIKRYDEIEELKQKLSPILQICPAKEERVQVGTEKCLRSLEPKLTKCVSDVVIELLLGIPQEREDKIRCPIYYFVAKCLEHKDEDSCAKQAGQLGLEEITFLPKELYGSCGNSVIKGAVKAYEHFKKKGEFVFEPKFVADEIRCVHEKAYDSKVWLYYIARLERSYEDICAGMSNIRDHLDNYTKKCGGAERYQEVDELRKKVDTIMEICPAKDQKVPIGMRQCVISLEKELRKCVIDALLEVTMGNAQANADKSRCSYYQFIIKCIVQKDEDICGKDPGQMVLTALEEMIDLPDEIQESCGTSVINGALNELAYDIDKSRKE